MMPGPPPQQPSRPAEHDLFALCLTISFAGGVKVLFDGPTVYYLDYGLRLLLVAVLARSLAVRELLMAGGSLGPVRSLFLALAVLLAMIVWDQAAWLVAWLVESDLLQRWSGYPVIPWGGLRMFDLTVGLALVAVTEEVVFRGLFARIWLAHRFSVWSLYLVSSLAFALIHLWQGSLPLVQTFGAGLLLMLLYRCCGTLWPPILVHYLINLFLFTDGPSWSGLIRSG